MKKGFIGLSLLLTFCLSACGASLFTPKTASSEESKNSITSVEESEESIETHSHSESTSKSESSETTHSFSHSSESSEPSHPSESGGSQESEVESLTDYIIDGTFVISGSPNKAAYYIGERLEYDGLIATADFYYAGHRDITNECTWDIHSSPSGSAYATAGEATIEVIAYYGNYQSRSFFWPISILSTQTSESAGESTSQEDYVISGTLRIHGELTKAYYVEGERWSYKGLTATLDFTVSGTRDVTNEATWNVVGVEGDNGVATLGVTSIRVSVSLYAEYWQETYDVVVNAKNVDYVARDPAAVYQKIGSANDLELNKTYLVAYDQAEDIKVMSTTIATNNIKETIYSEATNDKIVYSSDMLFLELVEGIQPGSYAFRVCNHPSYPDSNRYLCSTDSSNMNKLSSTDSVNLSASFSISYDESSVLQIMNLARTDRNLLRYNLNAKIFSLYNPNNGLNPVSLYKETDLPAPTVTNLTLGGSLARSELDYPFDTNWDMSGLQVIATYNDTEMVDVTSKATFNTSPEGVSLGVNTITVSASFKGFTSNELTFNVVVTEIPDLGGFSFDYDSLLIGENQTGESNMNRKLTFRDYVHATIDPNSTGGVSKAPYPYTTEGLGVNCIKCEANTTFLKVDRAYYDEFVIINFYCEYNARSTKNLPYIKYGGQKYSLNETQNGTLAYSYQLDEETTVSLYEYCISFDVRSINKNELEFVTGQSPIYLRMAGNGA